MKKLATIILMSLFSIYLYADPIKLEPKDPPKVENGKDFNRSEILVPSASIEDEVINIETKLATWGVTVTVYNGDGAVVYTSVSAIESQSHDFTVETLPSGNYTLEVQIGENFYEGDFVQ